MKFDHLFIVVLLVDFNWRRRYPLFCLSSTQTPPSPTSFFILFLKIGGWVLFCLMLILGKGRTVENVHFIIFVRR